MGRGSLAGSLWKKLSRGVERSTEARKSSPDHSSRSGNEKSAAPWPGGLLGTRMQWEMNEDVMVYTMVYSINIYIYIHIYIDIIQYTMIYTNDIYSGMSCIAKPSSICIKNVALSRIWVVIV
jgi:hypothetical protein